MSNINSQSSSQLSTSQTIAGKDAAAVGYWDKVLDPQNLERDTSARGITLESDIAFAQTPEFDCAARWLESGAAPDWTVDLGAGLGANAFALARRGHIVLAVDASPARLYVLRVRAREAGCADKIRGIVALAESLPFRNASVSTVFTKSVLIHTVLPRAAKELARVLGPGGRAALIEPQPSNPFVTVYRRTLAPRAWRAITRYFSADEQSLIARAVEGRIDLKRQVAPFYLFGFFAFVFQFGLPWLTMFRLSLRPLHGIDRLLFRFVPGLRKLAWFGVICLEKSSVTKDQT